MSSHAAVTTIDAILDKAEPSDDHRRLQLPPLTNKSRERRLVKSVIKRALDRGLDPMQVIVDIGCSPHFATSQVASWPCLTRTRCGARSYWVVARGRKASLKELARGMGLRKKELRRLNFWEHNVSPSQFGGMLGNSVVFPVARAVLKSAIRTTAF